MDDKMQGTEDVSRKMIRLQFGEIENEKLDALCGRTLAESYDIIAVRALKFLDWCFTTWDEGRQILFVNDVDALILSRDMLDQGTTAPKGKGDAQGGEATVREFSFSTEDFAMISRLKTLLSRPNHAALFADIFSSYEYYLDKLLEGRTLQYEDASGKMFEVEIQF